MNQASTNTEEYVSTEGSETAAALLACEMVCQKIAVRDSIYLSASNPTADAKGNVAGPSLVRVSLNSDHTVSVTPALAGKPNAIDITTGKVTTLNPTDPDSLIPMPGGGLLLDDQGDAQLLEVHQFSARQRVVRVLPLARRCSGR